MKKTTTLATKLFLMLFALSSFNVWAQKAAHEFSVYADGGISTYCFQPSTREVNFDGLSNTNKPGFKVNSSIGFCSDMGIGFTGFFSHQVGIHTSAGFGLMNVKSKANLYYITKGLTDRNGEETELHTRLINYTEIHKTMYVTIPVMLQFQTRMKQYWNFSKSQKVGFYAMGGVKLSFLFNNKFEAGVDSLFNAGYYPKFNNWAATQKFELLGDFGGSSSEGKLDFGVLVSVAVEMGVKWRIDKNIFVYTGAFFDCGLNDPIKDKRLPYGSFIDPNQLSDLSLLKFSDRINLMMAGIKLRFAFTRNQRPF